MFASWGRLAGCKREGKIAGMECTTPGNEQCKKERDQKSSRGACLIIFPQKAGKGVMKGATSQPSPGQKTSREAAEYPQQKPECVIDTNH